MAPKKISWGWIIFFASLFILLFWSLRASQAPSESISYNDFLAKLEQPGEMVLIDIQVNQNNDSGTIVGVWLKDSKYYKANFPYYSHPELAEIVDQAERSGVTIVHKPVSTFSWIYMLLILAPVVLIFFLLRKAGKQQINSIQSFVQKKDRLASRRKEKISDVAGIEEAKEEVMDIVDFLRNPHEYERLGARIPRGVLLVGPPGTGKTLLARAIAGEAGVPFFSISGSEFVEMFVGVGAARVRDFFEQAKQSAPSIVFIDEIDAVGRHRGSGLGQSHDEREQTLNQIFNEMDGFDERTNVIVLAATNRPDILDPALLRPKRFDRRVVVNKPDIRGREAILRVHTREKPLADDVNLENIARAVPGVSGADLENVTNEAAIIAVKKKKSAIDNSCFSSAIDKILMGKEKKLVMDKSIKESIAYHEAGHALVAKSLPGANPVRKISITARELSLGQTLMLEEEKYLASEQDLLNSVKILLGGRVAEEIFLQKKFTGAEDDLRRATEIVQKMVCHWGMSRLGIRSFGVKEEEIFLGREVIRTEDVSEETLKKIDEEVAKIINRCSKETRDILSKIPNKAEALVKALIKKETLEQQEIDAIFSSNE